MKTDRLFVAIPAAFPPYAFASFHPGAVSIFSRGSDAKMSVYSNFIVVRQHLWVWLSIDHGRKSRSNYNQHLLYQCFGQAVTDSRPPVHECVSYQLRIITVPPLLPHYLEKLKAPYSENPQIIGISFSEDIKLVTRKENVGDGYWWRSKTSLNCFRGICFLSTKYLSRGDYWSKIELNLNLDRQCLWLWMCQD